MWGEEADYNIKIDLDKQSKQIAEITIDRPGGIYELVSSSLVFGDVVEKNGSVYNCKDAIEDMILECDYNSDEDKSYCTITFELAPDPGDGVYGCEVIPEDIRNWIKSTLNLVKYIALVLVIVLGILDFIKAAASGEAEQMKKSGSSFLKRIIAVVILFLLPVIVELVLNLIEIYGANSNCLPE